MTVNGLVHSTGTKVNGAGAELTLLEVASAAELLTTPHAEEMISMPLASAC